MECLQISVKLTESRVPLTSYHITPKLVCNVFHFNAVKHLLIAGYLFGLKQQFFF